MHIITRLLLALILLVIAACDTTGSAQGGGTGNTGRGQIKIGVPF